MQKKRLVYIILTILLFSQFIPHAPISAATEWWNQDWTHRQDINIPIDTSDPYTHFLPIDLHIEFENPCWAKDTNEHSLRVIMHEKDTTQELELQIYDLIFSNTNSLQSCNIIFLIPDTATGEETYYLYYHDDKTPSPTYPDHLQIEESYYFYEPITGFPFESSFYKIIQDEEITYAVAYDGEFMGTGTTHQVTKMKSNVKEVKPQNGELFASFDFMYYYGNTMEDFSSTIDHFKTKEIKIDGNLMIEFGITSTSTKKDIQTTAIYTYYYCPTDHKRIYATVTHTALEPLKVASGSNVDGTYASLQVGGIKSTAIQDLNFGSINPYLHIYTEQDTIQQFPLDPDPEFIPDDWDIRVISTEDDIDLGTQAWASFDDGETGNAHALILEKTDIVTGDNEEPGIQVKAHEQDYPHLPGLSSDMAFFQFGRNSYETNTPHDLQIPEDFTAEFNAEFYTTHTGGYPLVDKEATLYHQLLTVRPTRGKNITTEIPDEETYRLTTYIHAAPAIPLGSILSAVTGRNFPYISAEIYKADTLQSSGIYGRVQFNPLPSLENKSILQKIQSILGIIDWKNLSIFKKITFENLPADTYILKIYRTNNLLGKNQRYIGVKIINLTQDTTTRIRPRPESKITITLKDQNNQPVPNANIIISTNNQPISIKTTDDTGTAILYAPQSLKTIYTLKINYQGYNIHTQPLQLRRRGIILPLRQEFQIQRHPFTFHVLDTWNLPPEIDVNPVLIGTSDETQLSQAASYLEPGYYQLQNITPNDYTLRLQYSTFTYEKPITIPSDDITITFPAEFNINLNILDSYGNQIDGTNLEIIRKDKQQKQENINSETTLQLPPGTYELTLKDDSSTISSRSITILGDRSYDLITSQQPWYLNLSIIITIILIVIALLLFYFRRNLTLLTNIISIGIIITAILLPWWTLSGSTSTLTSNTHFILLPTELITLIETPTVIAGELASLPEIIDFVVLILLASTIAGIIFLGLTMAIKNKDSLKYFTLLLLSFLAFLATIGIYVIAMSELSAATVGSFLGSGPLETSIPGQTLSTMVSSSWGPGIGLYLYLIATIIIAITLLHHTRTMTLFTAAGKKDRRILRKKLMSYFKKIIPLTGIILLIYIIYDIGIEKITDTFLEISPIYLIIAAALTFPRLFIRNTQWQYLLKSQKIIVSYWTSMKIFLISYFYGAITPGYLGLMIRIPYMKAATNQPFGKLFINSMAETAVHGLSLYIMMLLGALAVADQYPEILYGALIFVIANLIIYAFFIKKDRGEKTFYFFIRIMIPKIFKKHLTRFVDTFYEDFPHIREFIIPFLLGIPAWVIIYSQIYIISIPLEIQIPYFTFLVLYAIGNIVALIPITTAGLGTREAALIFLFGLYGVSPEKAVVISLAGHLLTDVLTGIYGFIISLTEARNVEYKQEMQEFLKSD